MTRQRTGAWHATAIVLAWLILSAIWGVLGAALGPGIAMLIVALLVGAVGALASLAQILWRRKPMTPYTGLFICACSVIALSLFVFRGEPTYRGLAFLTVYAAVPSFLISSLVNRFASPVVSG